MCPRCLPLGLARFSKLTECPREVVLLFWRGKSQGERPAVTTICLEPRGLPPRYLRDDSAMVRSVDPRLSECNAPKKASVAIPGEDLSLNKCK